MSISGYSINHNFVIKYCDKKCLPLSVISVLYKLSLARTIKTCVLLASTTAVVSNRYSSLGALRVTVAGQGPLFITYTLPSTSTD